jgi:hypothetical protein
MDLLGIIITDMAEEILGAQLLVKKMIRIDLLSLLLLNISKRPALNSEVPVFDSPIIAGRNEFSELVNCRRKSDSQSMPMPLFLSTVLYRVSRPKQQRIRQNYPEEY